jgi:hypothetical protein
MLSFLNLRNEYESWKQFRKSSFWKSINKPSQREDEDDLKITIHEIDDKYPNSRIKELTTTQKIEKWQECFDYSIGSNKFSDNTT